MKMQQVKIAKKHKAENLFCDQSWNHLSRFHNKQAALNSQMIICFDRLKLNSSHDSTRAPFGLWKVNWRSFNRTLNIEYLFQD